MKRLCWKSVEEMTSPDTNMHSSIVSIFVNLSLCPLSAVVESTFTQVQLLDSYSYFLKYRFHVQKISLKQMKNYSRSFVWYSPKAWTGAVRSSSCLVVHGELLSLLLCSIPVTVSEYLWNVMKQSVTVKLSSVLQMSFMRQQRAERLFCAACFSWSVSVNTVQLWVKRCPH